MTGHRQITQIRPLLVRGPQPFGQAGTEVGRRRARVRALDGIRGSGGRPEAASSTGADPDEESVTDPETDEASATADRLDPVGEQTRGSVDSAGAAQG